MHSFKNPKIFAEFCFDGLDPSKLNSSTHKSIDNDHTDITCDIIQFLKEEAQGKTFDDFLRISLENIASNLDIPLHLIYSNDPNAIGVINCEVDGKKAIAVICGKIEKGRWNG